MKFTNINTPVYVTADNTVISLILDITDFPNGSPDCLQVKFNASINDTEDHGVSLYNQAIAGDFGTIAPYVAPAIPPDIMGFSDYLVTELGALEANTLAKQYPLFFPFIETAKWENVLLLIQDAKENTAVITLDQYNIIKNGVETFHIPITLPVLTS